MTTKAEGSPASADRQWYIVGRWQEYEGEGRANLLRLIGIATFYLIELINYYGVDLGLVSMPAVVERDYHLAITLLTATWCALCASVLYCRKQGIFPYWLKFVSTGCDVLLLTAILTLSDGQRSPLVVAYFLLIALAALRFSLPLLWFATGSVVAGYLWLLGFAQWGELPGWPPPALPLPRYAQVMFLAALVLTGVVLGQAIRRVRGIASEYAARCQATRGGQP
jgi:hypothetical protein